MEFVILQLDGPLSRIFAVSLKDCRDDNAMFFTVLVDKLQNSGKVTAFPQFCIKSLRILVQHCLCLDQIARRLYKALFIELHRLKVITSQVLAQPDSALMPLIKPNHSSCDSKDSKPAEYPFEADHCLFDEIHGLEEWDFHEFFQHNEQRLELHLEIDIMGRGVDHLAGMDSNDGKLSAITPLVMLQLKRKLMCWDGDANTMHLRRVNEAGWSEIGDRSTREQRFRVELVRPYSHNWCEFHLLLSSITHWHRYQVNLHKMQHQERRRITQQRQGKLSLSLFMGKSQKRENVYFGLQYF